LERKIDSEKKTFESEKAQLQKTFEREKEKLNKVFDRSHQEFVQSKTDTISNDRTCLI